MLKKSAFTVCMIFGLTIASLAFAADNNDTAYYTIKAVHFQRLDQEMGPALQGEIGSHYTPLLTSPDDVLGQITDIINAGKQLWTIIQGNKPVVNVTEDVANAIPAAARSVSELDQWQGTRNGSYQTVFENMLGMDVVTLKYQVTFQFGGQYQQHGRYVANATVIPQSVSVAWGFRLDASAKVLQPANIGTTQDPVASLPILYTWKVTTPLLERDGTTHFDLQGDGQLRDLNN